MPADVHRSTSVARRRFTTEEVDVRRARGEISCAECRRLKLKCDKKLPCGSCVRRGCSTICPLGSLSTGQGTRFVLADTAQLHHKVADMGQRIRQLEDALAIFQSGVSNECHPLLRDELLAIKFGPEIHLHTDNEEPPRGGFIDSIDALGTLTINDLGECKYFGRSAGSETLFLAGADMEMTTSEDDEISPLSEDVARLSKLFPVGSSGEWNIEEALDMIFSFLPSRPRAWSLCETYLEHASWLFRPIRREELINEILTPIYRSVKERHDGHNAPHSVSAHQLAVLCMVFSIGALLDLLLPPCSDEAEHYFHLSRAALSLRSVFDSPEIYTVQAILLMSTYYSGGGKKCTMDSSWMCMSLAAKLAQSAGLHRDSARWNLDPKSVQTRRYFFWELFSADLFYSLALGRPPCIRLSYIDCEFPDDDEQTVDKNGQHVPGYWRWKFEFAKEVLSTVTELTLTAEAPSKLHMILMARSLLNNLEDYQTVLDLDLKVREKPLPTTLDHFLTAEDGHCNPSEYMRGCLLSLYRSVTLLYIHRSFFAQALLDNPSNPLRSPYAPSFLAAYRCASGVIKSSVNQFDRFPDLSMRWWAIWTHLFSAAVVVGSIVTRSPSLTMAPNAMIELGLVVGLFEKGSVRSRRARSGLAILCKLRAKALHVYSQFRSGNPSPAEDLNLNPLPDYGEDELALFGGQTRVRVSKISSRRFVHRRLSSPLSAASPSSPSSDTAPNAEIIPDIHPSLADYISHIPPSISSPSLTQNATFPMAQVLTCEPQSQSQQAGEHEGWTQSLPWQPSLSNFPSLFVNGRTVPSAFQDPMSYHTGGLPNLCEVNQEDSLMDLGLMTSGESGMDEQWMTFMRESGILEGSFSGLGS